MNDERLLDYKGAAERMSRPMQGDEAQEAGGVVAPVATGSTCGGRHWRWRACLAQASVVLVASDDDEAGERAAGWWLEALPGVWRLAPGGDLGDMLVAGEDVRAWVERGLA